MNILAPRFLFFLLISLLLFSVSDGNILTWNKKIGIGEKENPKYIHQKSYIKYSREIQYENKPVISNYKNVRLSFSNLEQKTPSNLEKLVYSKTKLIQPEKRGFSQFSFKDHHSEDIKYSDKAHGLFSNNILSISEDEHGFIWIASELDGLVKTNGDYSWNYTKENGLRSNTITRLYKDSKDAIWICWDKGLSYLKDGQLINIENEKINSARITRIREGRDKSVWIATEENGLFMLSNNEIESFNVERGLPSNQIQDIAFGNSNEIYIASISGGLSIIKDGRIENIRDKEPNVYEFAPTALHLSKGRLWIGSFAGSYFYLEDEKVYKLKFNKTFERCYEIAENEYGIWFADYGSGVNLLKTDGTSHSYNRGKGMTDRNAISLFIDHNKNVWVADPFSGLSVIRISPFRENAEFGGGVTSIVEDKNGLKWLVQNGGGLSRITGNKLENINCKVGKDIFTNDHPWDILPNSDGSYWAGTHLLGVVRMDGANYNYFRFTKGNIIMDITKGLNGDVWFSTTTDGLRKWDEKEGVFRLYSIKDGLTSNYVRSTTLDKEGKLWICTDKGVNIMKGRKIAVLDTKNGLSSNQVSKVVEDTKGRIWIATNDQGLNIISKGKILALSKKDGLIDNRVVSILETKNGNFWVMTSSGLSRLTETSSDNFKIENFGVSHGNFMLDFTGAALELPNGKILFGTNKRSVEFDPYFSKKAIKSTKFYMDEISVEEKSIPIKSKVIKVFNDQNIVINLSVLNWDKSSKNKSFYCFLKEGDKDTIWIPIKANEPIKAALEEKGTFQFLYKFKNKESFDFFYGPYFKVNIVWYESLWFVLAVFLVCFILINRFVKHRLHVLNKRKIELEEMVEIRTKELEIEKNELSKANMEILEAIEEKDVVIYEMHHRVKNNLQTISTLLDMQMRSLKNIDGISALKDAVRRISAMSTSHELLYSSDELSDINFKHFLTHLISSQSQLFTEQYSPSIVEYDIDDFSVNVTDCITIGMIVSEIISNSAKHAFEGVELPKITISARKVDDNCVFSVSDNGIGSDIDLNDGTSKGLGIRLIKIFTSKLKGKIKFGNNDPGLKIEITFPLNDKNKRLT